MSCKMLVERIVESARRGQELEGDLRVHLGSCRACLRRWEEESNLSRQLRFVSSAAMRDMRAEHNRERLLQEFAAKHPMRKHQAAWIAAIAAALVMVIFIPKERSRAVPAASEQTVTELDPMADGFTPVPYAPPLAPGEFISIVHANLPAADFARLGFEVDTESSIPVDVVLGQDGMPRAVRISREESLDN